MFFIFMLLDSINKLDSHPNSQEFSLLHVVQTGSGAHPDFYSPGVKRLGREADHSPPTSAEVKKTWIYTSIPSYVFMV
jgi:hypothetical protein